MSHPQDNTPLIEYELTAIGARRRLEALAAIGYTQTDLAELLNLQRGTFAFWRLDDVPAYKYADLADLFDQLQLVPGGSDRARAHARAHGWAPPLAWDEDTIDDPDAKPEGVPPRGYRRHNRIPADFIDMVLEHRELGHHDEDIAAAMGITLATLSRRLHRAGLGQRHRGDGTRHNRTPDYPMTRYRMRLPQGADRLRMLAGVTRSAS